MTYYVLSGTLSLYAITISSASHKETTNLSYVVVYAVSGTTFKTNLSLIRDVALCLSHYDIPAG